jgi:hypothetical protein
MLQVRDCGMSEWRECKPIGYCCVTIRDKSTRPDDLALRERMTELARERPALRLLACSYPVESRGLRRETDGLITGEF